MVDNILMGCTACVFATMCYGNVVVQADDVLQEATVVASKLQERELRNALEIYWLQEREYPTVEDEEMVTVLYEADLLEASKVSFKVEYYSPNELGYELSVS